jgi:hypothetical protein
MGRPIKAKYFVKGGPKDPSNIVKYEGVTVSINANGTHYSTGATATFSAPQSANGVNATLTLAVNTTTGAISAATIANVGSGYNVAPTVTVVPPATQTATVTTNTTNALTLSGVNGVYIGMKAVGTGINTATTYVSNIVGNVVTLTQNNANPDLRGNTITFSDVGSGATFTVGLTQTETVAAVPAAGQMTIIAKDSNGNSYYVTKLTSRKALLTRQTQNGSNAWLFASGSTARWALGWASASNNTIVGVQSY